MKNMKLIGCHLAAVIVFSGLFFSCSQTHVVKEYVDYVNVFIGTGGHGHTYPGATLPHGMVQLSPDTRLFGWDGCSGYYYADSSIIGFSHTHLSGTGIGDYGDILMMPTSGENKFMVSGNAEDPDLGYRSRFSHKEEEAVPGYYKVRLSDYDITAELTAALRTGFHRYTYPEGKAANLIIDMEPTIHGHQHPVTEIRIVNDSTVSGMKYTTGWAKNHYVYFYAEFSRPFTHTLYSGDTLIEGNLVKAKTAKALLTFIPEEAKKEVLVKVGISSVDCEGAKKNMKADISGWDFDKTVADARKIWNNELSVIDVKTDDAEQREIFYTALYHTAISPCIASDVDGRYRTMGHTIVQDTSYTNYTLFSLWDTFRALHPLYTVIRPDINQAFIRAFLRKYDESGVLPKWELASNETGTMIGYHAVPVIVDAYLKGIGDFDAKKALDACIATANLDNYRGIGLYKELGYIPYNVTDHYNAENWSLSKTLEYAFDDYCIAEMAKKMGKQDIADEFYKRSQNYKNVYNPATSFMQPRDDKGTFIKDFKADDYTPHICESNGWQYFWSVQHDINGLIDLVGGKNRFAEKLDSMFTYHPAADDELPIFSTGMIGQYAHGNEPSHHVIFLFNAIGHENRTQEYVAKVMNELYKNEPAGLCGNEDCGQMSAWYVFSAMGFYPVNPVSGKYEIGTPLFPEMQLHLANGKTFTVLAPKVNKENIYIQSIKIDGKTYDKTYLTHEQIMSGATVEFEMSNTPKAIGVIFEENNP